MARDLLELAFVSRKNKSYLKNVKKDFGRFKSEIDNLIIYNLKETNKEVLAFYITNGHRNLISIEKLEIYADGYFGELVKEIENYVMKLCIKYDLEVEVRADRNYPREIRHWLQVKG